MFGRNYHIVAALSAVIMIFAICAIMGYQAFAQAVGVSATATISPDAGVSGDFDGWYDRFCSADGHALFKYLSYAFGTSIAASLAANFKRLQSVPVLGVVVNFLGGNWREIMEVLAKSTSAQQTKKAIAFLMTATAMGFVLSACATTSGETPAQQIQQVLQTVQPVESQLACSAQALCNQTTAAANTAALLTASPTAVGIAAGGQLCSIAAGTFCNGLSAGAKLPTPVPVAGTVLVPIPGGSTIAVPAVTVAPVAAPAS
jgi:hypothetical protein